MSVAPNGRLFFIDHNTHQTSWVSRSTVRIEKLKLHTLCRCLFIYHNLSPMTKIALIVKIVLDQFSERRNSSASSGISTSVSLLACLAQTPKESSQLYIVCHCCRYYLCMVLTTGLNIKKTSTLHFSVHIVYAHGILGLYDLYFFKWQPFFSFFSLPLRPVFMVDHSTFIFYMDIIDTGDKHKNN